MDYTFTKYNNRTVPSTCPRCLEKMGCLCASQRWRALAAARASVQEWGQPQRLLSSDLYEAYAAGALSLLELRYAIEGRCRRRHTPACWRLLAT